MASGSRCGNAKTANCQSHWSSSTGDGDYVAIDTSRRPILRIRWSRGIRASQRGTRSSKRSVTTSDNSSWSSFERQQTDSAPHACQGGTARPLEGRLIARSSPRLVGAASTCGAIRLVVVSDLPPLRVKENSQPGKSALQTDVAVTLGLSQTSAPRPGNRGSRACDSGLGPDGDQEGLWE